MLHTRRSYKGTRRRQCLTFPFLHLNPPLQDVLGRMRTMRSYCSSVVTSTTSERAPPPADDSTTSAWAPPPNAPEPDASTQDADNEEAAACPSLPPQRRVTKNIICLQRGDLDVSSGKSSRFLLFHTFVNTSRPCVTILIHIPCVSFSYLDFLFHT